jgi:hypothetical protein
MALKPKPSKPVRSAAESPEPITVPEVSQVVLEAIALAFGDRPLDCHTARRGLAHAVAATGD